jgi:hypothetical protein
LPVLLRMLAYTTSKKQQEGLIMKKTCNDCGLEFPKTSDFFNYQNKKKGYLSPYCKECSRKRNKKTHRNYYLNNKETIIEKTTLYRKENKELVSKRKQDYYKKNKESIRKQQAIYLAKPETKKLICEREKEKRKEDPSYKMRCNVNRLVRLYLKKGGSVKQGYLWNALPYTPQQLKEHLENQFEDWMTWENYGNGYGKWNIDHIIPQSKLLYDNFDHPNFLKCWSLENLRPMCSIENIRKSDKINWTKG